MPYFSYHGRNKKLIKEGNLVNYFYEENGNRRFLVLVFKDGRQFPIKEERWIEYTKFIENYYCKGDESDEEGI